jgi:hypothetical protein
MASIRAGDLERLCEEQGPASSSDAMRMSCDSRRLRHARYFQEVFPSIMFDSTSAAEFYLFHLVSVSGLAGMFSCLMDFVARYSEVRDRWTPPVALSHLILQRAGRRVFRPTSPRSCAGVATCNCATFRFSFRTSSTDMKADTTIFNCRCRYDQSDYDSPPRQAAYDRNQGALPRRH